MKYTNILYRFKDLTIQLSVQFLYSKYLQKEASETKTAFFPVKLKLIIPSTSHIVLNAKSPHVSTFAMTT